MSVSWRCAVGAAGHRSLVAVRRLLCGRHAGEDGVEVLSLPGLVGLQVAAVAQLVSSRSRRSFDVDPLVAVEATANSRTELLGTTEEGRRQLAVLVGGDSCEALDGASDADVAAVTSSEDECFAVSAPCLVEIADLFGHVSELRQAVRSSAFLVGGTHHRHRPAESIGDRPGRLVAPTSIVVVAGAPVSEPEAVQRDRLGGGQGSSRARSTTVR